MHNAKIPRPPVGEFVGMNQSMQRMLITICGLGSVVAVLLVTARAQEVGIPALPMSDPETVGMSSIRLDRIKTTMQRYIDDQRLAGVVTLIARHGKVVHLEAQGWRDNEADQRMTPDTIFTIMSMTKPIVSTALMVLYEEGHFLLDDPISKWIPGYANKEVRLNPESPDPQVEPAVRPITVRHILTHTSGLSLHPDFRPSFGLPSRLGDFVRPRNTEEAIARAADRPLAFHPGDQWQYGDSTDYVALLVEKMSGQNLQTFLQQRLFRPLGMNDTHYNVPRSKTNRVAAVYRHTGPHNTIELFRTPSHLEPTFYYGGVAGLNSTVSDYYLFHQMMLNGGELNGTRILSPRTINLMISNHIGDKEVDVWGPGYGWGLGYCILTDPGRANEHLSPGSFFWTGAWNTISWVDPIEDMVAVAMTQVTPFGRINFLKDISVVASQAIVESNRHNPPTVLGYERRK